MRVLNVLYVTGHRSKVGLQKGTVLITDPEAGKVRAPLSALEAIVLLGGSQISTQLLAECVDRHIRVVALRRNGKVRFAVGAPVRGNVHLRIGQYSASQDPDHTARIARTIVAGKLQNYRRLLHRWAWDAHGSIEWTLRDNIAVIDDRIRALPAMTDGDRIRGIEGDATRRYFKGLRAALFGSGFIFESRNRRPPRDPVNSLLSFIYGLVLSETVGAVETVGLDPQIGFLHGVRPGRASLGLDMIEELRPSIADKFAVGLLRRRQLGDSDFTFTPGGACYLSDQGRASTLAAYESFKEQHVTHPLLNRDVPRWSLATIQATLMARHLRGDIADYPPFVMAS